MCRGGRGGTACMCPESCMRPSSWGFEGPIAGVARQSLESEPGQLQARGPPGSPPHPTPTGS